MMHSLRLGIVKTLIRQDLYYALRSTRGLLFLVFFLVFWFWVLWKLSSGSAQYLAGTEANMVLSYLIDENIVQALFSNRSPTFSAFYYLAIATVPIFILFAASDQTANDIGSKYLRFLTPRCNRLEIFVGRFFGAVILVATAYIIISLLAATVAITVDQVSLNTILADVPLVVLSLVFYSIPFIAFMSLCSVIVGSVGLSALMGISAYVISLILISIIGIKMPDIANIIGYILPNASKGLYLQLSWSSLINAVIFMPIYIFSYGYLGWIIFKKRDI